MFKYLDEIGKNQKFQKISGHLVKVIWSFSIWERGYLLTIYK